MPIQNLSGGNPLRPGEFNKILTHGFHHPRSHEPDNSGYIYQGEGDRRKNNMPPPVKGCQACPYAENSSDLPPSGHRQPVKSHRKDKNIHHSHEKRRQGYSSQRSEHYQLTDFAL